MQLFTVLFLFFVVKEARCCRIVLNELNIDGPRGNEYLEYFELKKINCYSQTPSLQFHLLLVLKEFEASSNGPVVIFSADFNNSIFPQSSSFYVIGPPLIKPNLAFDNDNVRYRKKFRTPMQLALNLKAEYETSQLKDVIENGNKVPLAVVLLHGKTYLNKLIMPFPKPLRQEKVFAKSIVINSELEDIIKNSLLDMYIFSRRSFINSCNFFRRLSTFKSPTANYKIGTEFDVLNHPDVSVNRCPTKQENEDMLFMHTHFRIGRRTPHEENDCSGAHFIIEESVDDILQYSQPCCSRDMQQNNDLPECSTIPKVYQLRHVTSDSIVNERNCQMDIAMAESSGNNYTDFGHRQCACVNIDGIPNDESELENVQSIMAQMSAVEDIEEPMCKKKRLTQKSDDSSPVKPWKDTSHFVDLWSQQIQKYQSRIVASSLLNTENKIWLRYIFNENNPKQSTFQCRFCLSYVSKRPELKNVPFLAQASGYIVSDYLRMWKQITSHTSSSVHQKAVLESKEEYLLSIKECSKNVKQKIALKISKEHLPTLKMIRTVYAEIKINLPFAAHSTVVELQKLNGVELGNHHFDRNSATRISENISQKMHQILLQHFKTKHYPMSIILDTSSDFANKNYMLVYFRSIEQNYPTIYFYRCLYVPLETAESLFNTLRNALVEDGLLQTVTDYLYGFGSDGAPVMLGKHNGLAQRLSVITKNKLYTLHCLAHKLELTLGKALKTDNLKEHLEDFVNGIYSFYYDRSFKRKQSLIDTAEALGAQFNELHNIHGIRWISSQFTAFKSLYNLYPFIVQNMQLIMDSNEFTDDVSRKAKSYKSTLLQTHFFTTFTFVMDILKVLLNISKEFQRSDSTLIGKETIRLQLFNALTTLKEQNGPFLKLVQQHALCKKENKWNPCSMLDLDGCDLKFVMREQELMFTIKDSRNSNNIRWKALSNVRIKIIDDLLKELNHYFPEGSFEMFEVLNPSKLPLDVQNIPLYSKGISVLANRFKFNIPQIERQFENLLESIIVQHHEMFCNLKNKGPEQFWNFFLNNNMVNWQENIKQLIYITLALPVGSADVERGFSIKNYFKTHWRSTLTTTHIEDIMRIRVNGPAVTDFDAVIYTLHWLKTNHIDTDDPRWSNLNEENSENYRKSKLF